MRSVPILTRLSLDRFVASLPRDDGGVIRASLA
jgi:hypothetical protein